MMMCLSLRKNGIIALAQDFKSRFTHIPNITSEYRLTGQMAADFLLQKGFRHFAFYGYKDVVWSQEALRRISRAHYCTRFWC